MEARSRRQQVRVFHIIYILSHSGRIEHPHLIRIRHLNKNGIYLRDVKRWLSDLRGKDMPEKFSWSYKRRYKNGYVWQDLLDGDLITPISDNEYVLKGSEITTSFGPYPRPEKRSNCRVFKELPNEEGKYQNKPFAKEAFSTMNTNPTKPKTCSEIREEWPTPSSSRISASDDQEKVKISVEENTEKTSFHEEEKRKKVLSTLSSLHASLLNKRKKKGSTTSETSSSSQSSSSTSKSHSGGASQGFRSWLPCRSADADGNVFVSVTNGEKRGSKKKHATASAAIVKPEIRNSDKLGGSTRNFAACWDSSPLQPQHYNARRSFDEVNNVKSNSGNLASCNYKPLNNPICKQCRRSIKPESWIQHVQSCKQTRAILRQAAASSEGIPFRRSVS